jgi:CarD family transcriptional regulator
MEETGVQTVKRYQPGDLVVYGSAGVCRVETIMEPDFEAGRHGFDRSRTYYVLIPFYRTEIIYVPTDNPKVFMRPIITREEAEQLIDSIPEITVKGVYASSLQELRNYYRAATSNYECSDLVELTMSIYAKKKDMQAQKKKIGQVDGDTMKKAEEMLFGELAVALGIDKEKVPEYIAKRVSKLKK